MRMCRVVPYGPGVYRVRRGRGFSYRLDDGSRLRDDTELERIKHLAIPPAWRKVWICRKPNGHIQAVGIDSAGRRQYLYHQQWRSDRDEEKFERMLDFAQALPKFREQVRHDLMLPGAPREKVEAIALKLLDYGVFRVGGEAYAEENGTRGVATLLRRQVRLSGDCLTFDFIAKGGARRKVSLVDAPLADAVRAIRRRRAASDRLLAFADDTGEHELRAQDINSRIRDLTDCDCSAKDFRTWHATVLAAESFAGAEPAQSVRQRKKVEREVVIEVSELLGNTPTIARNSYIDPRVFAAYEDGRTISRALRRAQRLAPDDAQPIIDKAVVTLLRKTPR